MIEKYPSQWLEKAVEQLSMLPGIGRKTALRLALHMLRQPEGYAISLAHSIEQLRTQTTYCRECHNISDTEHCAICADQRRDHSTICVVESVKEVIAFEQTARYRGVYHVLGGVIAPVEGIGPANLEIDSLVQRIEQGGVQEVILALRSTMEGDATNYFINQRLKMTGVKITIISRGIAVGDQIEYADEVTLGSALMNRTPFDKNF